MRLSKDQLEALVEEISSKYIEKAQKICDENLKLLKKVKLNSQEKQLIKNAELLLELGAITKHTSDNLETLIKRRKLSNKGYVLSTPTTWKTKEKVRQRILLATIDVKTLDELILTVNNLDLYK